MADDEDEMTEADPAVNVNRLIGLRVYAFRKARNLTQEQVEELTAQLGRRITQGHQAYLEGGGRKWTPESLSVMSAVLKVRMADLMPDADKPPPEVNLSVPVTEAEMGLLMVWRTQGIRAAVNYLLGFFKE